MTLVLLAAVVLLAVFGLAPGGSSKGGRPAPALPREKLSGGPATISNLLASSGERSAAVVFWASWCGPCGREAPSLERFARSAAGRGRIVGVDWNDPVIAEAKSFIRRYGWSFPNLRDAEGTVGNSYRLTSLPTSFVIDRRGRIVAELHGPQDEASLTRALAAAEGA
jgi:cytochrome c biogenesis protein CcmG, thiol:disulfide interchange protein DsbE